MDQPYGIPKSHEESLKTDLKKIYLKKKQKFKWDHKREGYKRVRELYAQKTEIAGARKVFGEYLEGMKGISMTRDHGNNDGVLVGRS